MKADTKTKELQIADTQANAEICNTFVLADTQNNEIKLKNKKMIRKFVRMTKTKIMT